MVGLHVRQEGAGLATAWTSTSRTHVQRSHLSQGAERRMAVMVTGGVGMIGSNIVRRLALHTHDDVVVFDRVPAPETHSPLSGLDVSYVVGSITDLSLLLHTIKKFRVNSIVHLAAIIANEATDRPVEAM